MLKCWKGRLREDITVVFDCLMAGLGQSELKADIKTQAVAWGIPPLDIWNNMFRVRLFKY